LNAKKKLNNTDAFSFACAWQLTPTSKCEINLIKGLFLLTYQIRLNKRRTTGNSETHYIKKKPICSINLQVKQMSPSNHIISWRLGSGKDVE
jgi:hypothetical protein